MVSKKKTLQACERDRFDVVERRAKWIRNQRRWDADKLVFLDEMGVNRGMTPQYAWAPKGERAVSKAPHNPGQNISVVGAIRLRGFITADWKVGGFTSDDFEAFVRDELAPKLKRGDVVVMDNASIHKRPNIKRILRGYGVRLWFLPPYSPELNPKENGWSKSKNVVRRCEPRTLKQTVAALAMGLRSITEQDCIGWFKHAGYSVKSN